MNKSRRGVTSTGFRIECSCQQILVDCFCVLGKLDQSYPGNLTLFWGFCFRLPVDFLNDLEWWRCGLSSKMIQNGTWGCTSQVKITLVTIGPYEKTTWPPAKIARSPGFVWFCLRSSFKFIEGSTKNWKLETISTLTVYWGANAFEVVPFNKPYIIIS